MPQLTKTLIGPAVLILAACTSTPSAEPTTTPAAAAPATAARADDESRTGSRIPKNGGGDRMLKTVGARDARDSFDNQAKPMERTN